MQPPLFWWVGPTVVGLGVLVALGAIYWNRKVARLKATLDLIEGSESKDYYQQRYRAFREFRRGGAYRSGVLSPQSDADRLNRDMCFDFLNHYELVAISCARGIIDEEFYRAWMGGVLVRDWEAARDLVLAARAPDQPGERGAAAAYAEFEALALKWGGRFISRWP